MAALAELVKTPYWDKKDPPELQFRHDMMRAKLYGFTERADSVMRRYPSSDTSMPARYARAIATYRYGDLRSAHRADRRSDPGDAQLSVFLRAQGPGTARKRARDGGTRTVAPRYRDGAQPRSHSDPAGAGAYRHEQCQADVQAIPLLRTALAQGTRIRRCLYEHLRWPMATAAIWPMPIWLRRKLPSLAATIRLRANSRRAPRRGFRSARRAGFEPTILSLSTKERARSGQVDDLNKDKYQMTFNVRAKFRSPPRHCWPRLPWRRHKRKLSPPTSGRKSEPSSKNTCWRTRR